MKKENDNITIGYPTTTHKDCILIGEGAQSDGDSQIVIGNKGSAELKIYPSGDIFINGKLMGTDYEFAVELKNAFKTTFLFNKPTFNQQ